MAASLEKNQAPGSLGAIAQNMAGIALVVMLVALGAAYCVDQLGRTNARAAPALDDGEPIAQTVAGRELQIPSNWFRFGEQMDSGFISQTEFNVVIDGRTVDVTLLPRSRARGSSELLDSVYVHQFTPGTVSGPPGLVGKALQGNGYDGETVWYDALAARPFVAKCIDAVTENAPARCVRTVHLPNGLAAIFGFDADILAGWRSFDAEISPWLERIGAL
jgi:hypothetical protein